MWNVTFLLAVVSTLPSSAFGARGPCPGLETSERTFRLPSSAVVGTAHDLRGQMAIGLWKGRQFLVRIDGNTYEYAEAPRGSTGTPSLHWVGNSSILVRSSFAADALIDANERRVIVGAEDEMKWLDGAVDGQFFAFSAKQGNQIVVVNERWERTYSYFGRIALGSFLGDGHGVTDLVVMAESGEVQRFKLSPKGLDAEGVEATERPGWFRTVGTIGIKLENGVFKAVSRDGRFAANGATDGKIILREIGTSKERTLQGPNGRPVTDLHFGAGDTLHATWENARHIRVWRLNSP